MFPTSFRLAGSSPERSCSAGILRIRESSGSSPASGRPAPPFPFGDGAVAQMQQLGQLFLGQPLFQTEGTDQRPGFFQIHFDPLVFILPDFWEKATNAP